MDFTKFFKFNSLFFPFSANIPLNIFRMPGSINAGIPFLLTIDFEVLKISKSTQVYDFPKYKKLLSD